MADLITLTCPMCGGSLQITNDVDRFVCAHCGNAHVIDPGARVESLAAEVSMLRAETGIRRLHQELGILIEKRDQLRSTIDSYRKLAISLYRSAGIAAYFLAIAFAVIGFGALTSQMPNRGVLAIGAVFVVGLMVVAGRNTKHQAIVLPNLLDNEVREAVRIDRLIAQKQRELDRLQRQIGFSPGTADDLTGSDTQHALRITSP